jgi:LCP family protein required for cell wall assembly
METMLEEQQSFDEMPPEDDNSGQKNKNWRIILLVVVIGIVVVACTLLTELFIRPLAEPLFVRENTPTPTDIMVTEDSGGGAVQPTEAVEPTDSSDASACSQTGTMSFMILGVDMPYSDPPKGADAIRLVQLDFSAMEATMIAVPRDLWVSTPVLNDQNIFSNRIGLTYYYAKQDVPDGNDETVYATTLLAQTLYDNFGFVPDHYMVLHLDNFDDIVDALGGITVEVPEEYESVSYIYTPGTVTMNGDQALEYASNLINDDTVWERLARQQLVIDSILEKVTSPSIIFNIPALITEFNDTITTDLSLSDMTDLSCLATDLDMNTDITTIELESPYVTPQEDSPVLLPDDEMIIDLFEATFN